MSQRVKTTMLDGLDPELRELAQHLAHILQDLDLRLVEQDVTVEERQAIQRMVLTALECHLRKREPPSEEIAFWMKLLDANVSVSDQSCIQ